MRCLTHCAAAALAAAAASPPVAAAAAAADAGVVAAFARTPARAFLCCLLQALAYGGAPRAGVPLKGLGAPIKGLGAPLKVLRGPSAVDAYYDFISSHSFSICLPFRLRAVGAPKGAPCNFLGFGGPQGGPYGRPEEEPPEGDCSAAAAAAAAAVGPPSPVWLSTLYAVELSFSLSPSYEPLSSVCIPFLQCPLGGPPGGPSGAPGLLSPGITAAAANSKPAAAATYGALLDVPKGIPRGPPPVAPKSITKAAADLGIGSPSLKGAPKAAAAAATAASGAPKGTLLGAPTTAGAAPTTHIAGLTRLSE